MHIHVTINDFDNEVKSIVNDLLKQKIEKTFQEVVQKIDIEQIINERIKTLIDKSKYVSDSIIRNLVQQKIARELSDKVFKELLAEDK
jgi:FixJ family two-component response regulator